MRTKRTAIAIQLKIGIFLLLIAVIYGSANECHGQGCLFERNEVDKFTGNRVVKTKYKMLSGKFQVAAYKINQTTYIDLAHGGQLDAFSVDEGNELIILFQDKSKMILKNLEYTLADHFSGAGITVWGVRLLFTLTPDQIFQLTSKPIGAIRLYRNDGYVDDDIKDRNKLKSAQALQSSSHSLVISAYEM